ncbi:MAG: DUF1294 domain-containing protein [Paracoccaceae bacterium]
MNPYDPNPDTLGMLGLSLVAWLLLMNLATFVVFAVDKQRALNDEERISEMWLLSLAALGGWPAAKLAQWFFRHKTRQEPFRTMLNMVVLPLIAILGLVAYEKVDFAAVWTTISATLSAQIASAGTTQAAPDAAAPVVNGVPNPVATVAQATTDTAASVATTAHKPDDPALPQRFGPGASAKNGKAWKSK